MAWRSIIPRMATAGDSRTRSEIERDVEVELGFHIERLSQALVEEGVDPLLASSEAIRRFGDVDQWKAQCVGIALEERIMLQRINLVLMIVVLSVVVIFGVQVINSQRSTSQALGGITARLEQMQAVALPQPMAERAKQGGNILVEGAVSRPGVYNLPKHGRLSMSRLITAAGGAPQAGVVRLHRFQDGFRRKASEFKLPADWTESEDPILQDGDLVVVVPGGSELELKEADPATASP